MPTVANNHNIVSDLPCFIDPYKVMATQWPLKSSVFFLFRVGRGINDDNRRFAFSVHLVQECYENDSSNLFQ